MNTKDCLVLWLFGLLPSLIFGYGGTILWTVIIIIIDRYYDSQYPQRNGSRTRRESIHAENNLSVEEKNYFDIHPTKYKTYWNWEYVIKDVKDGHHGNRSFDFKYFRCPHCGHIMKVLIWKEYPETPLPITRHWCRGCQKEVDVIEISKEEYEYENKYAWLLYDFMIYTKNGNPDEITKLLYVYWKKLLNNEWGYDPNLLRDDKRVYLSKEFENNYNVKNECTSTGEPLRGAKYIYYNASKIAREKYPVDRFIDSKFFNLDTGYDGIDIGTAVAMFDKLRKYEFYRRMYIPEKMPIKNYLQEHCKYKFLQFIDEDGIYNPPEGIDWRHPERIAVYNGIE